MSILNKTILVLAMTCSKIVHYSIIWQNHKVYWNITVNSRVIHVKLYRAAIRRTVLSFKNRVSNGDVLTHAGMSGMFAILSQRHLRWLGHVSRMYDGRIPNGHPLRRARHRNTYNRSTALRYRCACKRDLKSCNINPAELEKATADRPSWRANMKTGIKQAKKRRDSARGQKEPQTAENQCSLHDTHH